MKRHPYIPSTPPPTAPLPRNGSQRFAETRTTILGDVAPPLPHEHDESSRSQIGEPTEIMHRAKTDLDEGRVDTDRGDPVNDLYHRQFKTVPVPDMAPPASTPPQHSKLNRKR